MYSNFSMVDILVNLPFRISIRIYGTGFGKGLEDEMSEVVIVAEMALAEGREEEALEVLDELCRATHEQDEGCLLYAVHRVTGDDRAVFLLEKWRSREDLDRHLAAPHVAAKRAREAELFAGASRASFLEPTGFGRPEMATV
jgi:quinol monooxygenase YgiN